MVNGFVSTIFGPSLVSLFLETCPTLKAAIDTPSIMYSAWLYLVVFKTIILPLRESGDNSMALLLISSIPLWKGCLCFRALNFHSHPRQSLRLTKFSIKISAHTKTLMAWRTFFIHSAQQFVILLNLDRETRKVPPCWNLNLLLSANLENSFR